MTAIGNRKLVFYLGGIGFLLELVSVVEVVAQIAGILDSGRSDIGRGIVAVLKFRQTWIPVVDPVLKMDVLSSVKLKDKVIIVLRGSEGNWALLVDRVEELLSVERFQPCEIPFLLKAAAIGFYSQIKLLNNEPMVVFEPECYYGSVIVSA